MATREREEERGREERAKERREQERERARDREREREGEGARERDTHTLSLTHGVGGTVEWRRRIESLVFVDLFLQMSPNMSGRCAGRYLTLLKSWY